MHTYFWTPYAGAKYTTSHRQAVSRIPVYRTVEGSGKPWSLNLSHFEEDQNDPSTSRILPSWPSGQWGGRAPPVRSVPPVQRHSVGLLLDSRVVDVPRSYNSTFGTLTS